MCKLIEEALTAAVKANIKPAQIRLGHRQMKQFREWAVEFVGGAPSEGPSEAYDDIPVHVVNKEIHCSVIGTDGYELILD